MKTKNLTKTALKKDALKKEIKNILKETVSKCVKLARANGYEINATFDALDIESVTPADIEDFENGEEYIKCRAETCFIHENFYGLQKLSDFAEYNDLKFTSEKDIKKFIKEFNALRNQRIQREAIKRQRKIKRLRAELAELEAEG